MPMSQPNPSINLVFAPGNTVQIENNASSASTNNNKNDLLHIAMSQPNPKTIMVSIHAIKVKKENNSSIATNTSKNDIHQIPMLQPNLSGIIVSISTNTLKTENNHSCN